MQKYQLVVESTRFSVPSSFASIITREQTTLEDEAGVWQKDRGGKHSNHLIADLAVMDLNTKQKVSSIPSVIHLQCELYLVMEDGALALDPMDVVNRKSEVISERHLQGAAKKLEIVDAEPTGHGIRITTNAKAIVKYRINDLCKKGTPNNRMCVVFRPVESGSEEFAFDESNPPFSHPIRVYTKVVKGLHSLPTTIRAITEARPVSMPPPSRHTTTTTSSSSSSTMNNNHGGEPSVELVKVRDMLKHSQIKGSSEDVRVLNEILETCKMIQKKLLFEINQPHSRNMLNLPTNPPTRSHPPPPPPSISSNNNNNSSSSNNNKKPKLDATATPPDLFDEKLIRISSSFSTASALPTTSIEDIEIDFLKHAGDIHQLSGDFHLEDDVLTMDFLSDDFLDGGSPAESGRSPTTVARVEIPISFDMQARIYKEFDENGDGRVTMDEFIRGIKKRENELTPLFNSMDLDGDGFLTFEELRASKMLKDVADEEIKKLIEFVDELSDEEKDGRISLKEFLSTFTLLPSSGSLEYFIRR